MNDRYLFRGKRKDNGEWIYGGIYYQKADEVKEEAVYIIGSSLNYVGAAYEVIPATVGQCTGLKDKNCKLMFEGDILKGFRYPFLSEGEHNYYAIVVWFENSPAFGISTVKNPHSKVRGISDGNTDYIEEWDSSKWEVIGNIHDNPNLLKLEHDSLCETETYKAGDEE